MNLIKSPILRYASLAILIIAGAVQTSVAQERDILAVLNDQVDAFNKADVQRLVDNVSDDFKYFYISSDVLTLELEGRSKFRASMDAYFKRDRKVTSRIDCYFIDGNRISFREVVSHKNAKGETVSSSAMGIYEVKNGKITRSWYFVDQ